MSGYKLREYQQEAVEKALATAAKRPLIVLPTGAGKSLVCASLANSRSTLILVPSKELVKQNAEKINPTPEQWYGGAPDLTANTVVTTFASALSKRNRDRVLNTVWDLVIVDEAHRISVVNKIGRLLSAIDAKIIGLTATPFRSDSNLIFGPDSSQFFDECSHESTRLELVGQSFLSKRNFKEMPAFLNGEGIKRVGGDYQNDELGISVIDKSLECLDRLPELENALLFTVNVDHAKVVAEYLGCHFITGMTPDKERERMLTNFKSGEDKYLVSVETLTTGFDYPNLKNIVVLRPTQSRVLYEQILGRGDRLKDDGNNECNIYDFTDNFFRFVIDFDPFAHSSSRIKKCPFCANLTDFAMRTCGSCKADLRPALGMDAPITICPGCDHENHTRAFYCERCSEPLKNARYTSKPRNFLKLKSLRVTNASKQTGWRIMVNNNPRYIISFTHMEILQDPFKEVKGLLVSLANGKTAKFKTEYKLFVSRNMSGDLSLERIK